jgi:hypothetical protein
VTKKLLIEIPKEDLKRTLTTRWEEEALAE